MKKIIMMSGLLFVAFFSKAATISQVKEKKSEIKSYQIFQGFESTRQEDPVVQCTVSLKGSLFMGFLSIEVTCTGTGTTCQQATEKAAACLQEAIKAVKEILD